MVLKRARASWWVLLLLAVLCVFPVATAALSQAADAGADVVDSCWESDLPEGVQPRDGTLRSAEVTAIPAGLHCDWEAGDTQTGWPVTVAALIASGACVVLTPFALRQGGAARRVVSLLPVLAIGLIWLAIWSNTVFVIID